MRQGCTSTLGRFRFGNWPSSAVRGIYDLWEKPQARPRTASFPLERAVNLKFRYRGSSSRCSAANGTALLVHFKMHFPSVITRVEQSHRVSDDLILSGNVIGFEQVAGSTGERQVGLVVASLA